MYLGIEIGGTKLQLGIGSGRGGPLLALRRCDVQRDRGAAGIRQQLRDVGRQLLAQHEVNGIGIGFGGPVQTATGRTVRSFQIEGWDDFPLGQWCREQLGRPTVVGNDSDLAGLGEARFGAGRGADVVFYSNVGSGIGGALVISGSLYGGSGGVASELGHLRPGLAAREPEQTVESISSGWAIAEAVRSQLDGADSADAADWLRRCDGDLQHLTARTVAEAYAQGNQLASDVFRRAIETYGWALAQMVTLVAPQVVVIGGGVPLVGENLYLQPLRRQVAQYVYRPLAGTYRIVPAALGEEVVVHGALALAASTESGAPQRR